MPDSTKKQIHILGGGVGALTAAFFLTERPDWRNRNEITVYQPGWRLGGKGASGRNGSMGNRIEEHGLHVWFGFYENAFRLMRECYAALDRPTGSPMARVEDAFKPKDFVPMMEQTREGWSLWPLTLPPLPGTPGEADSQYTPWDVIRHVLQFAADALDDWLDTLPDQEQPGYTPLDWIDDLLGAGLSLLPRKTALHISLALLRRLGPEPLGEDLDRQLDYVIEALKDFRRWLDNRLEAIFEEDEYLRRLWILSDLALTAAIGMLDDRLMDRGLDSIDDEEFRDWLSRHGAARKTIDSTPVRALYDCCFAYENGDIDRPNFAAGAALGCALRIGVMYRGHVLYEMQAGMGDVVVAPLYLVLKKRGVKFAFFHKVKKLALSADGTRIAQIYMAKQVNLNNAEYEPLIDVAGLPCWPSEPRFDQIKEGEALCQQEINLESHWTPWEDVDDLTVEVAEGDQVVLGISLGALTPICEELAERNEDWRNLIDKLPTMQTQSVQLWMKPDLQGLGWMKNDPLRDGDRPSPAMVAAPEPLDVWADMSHLLAAEGWPADGPQSIQYLCGPLKGDMLGTYPPTDYDAPEVAAREVRATAEQWFDTYTGWFWPDAVSGQDLQALDWDLLYSSDASLTGSDRLQAQWLRANIDPSERYVLSPAKRNRYRLPSCHSSFQNLVLAGDWTRTAINAGCVEAAVMSGMEAARALRGYPEHIAGEHFMQGDWVSPCEPPLKIAVLGSGCGALSAAFWLTATPALRNKYAVTVYTQGWRVGGKGASGRNRDHHERIEEHGLHLMLGFYDTVFHTVRACYREMGHDPDDAYPTWLDALEPQRQISLQTRWPPGASRQHWRSWNIDFPRLPGLPGSDALDVEPNRDFMSEAVNRLLDWLVLGAFSELLSLMDPLEVLRRYGESARDVLRGLWRRMPLVGDLPDPIDFLRVDRRSSTDRQQAKLPARQAIEWILDKVFADVLAEGADYYVENQRQKLIENLEQAQRAFKQFVAPTLKLGFWLPVVGFDLYRFYTLIDLGLAGLKGYLKDVLPLDEEGFQKINDQDFKDWLEVNGAAPDSARSALIMGLYDLAFAYEDGDSSSPDKGRAAAGAMLRLVIRMAFTYQNAPLWKMNAGMGDIIFTPLYKVLKQRGVQFKFFHRVTDLHLSPDGKTVSSIDLQRQARTQGDRAYQPLRKVPIRPVQGGRTKNWDCWPSEPLWEQIEDADSVRGQNFEDPWDHRHVDTVTLNYGEEFHKVVLGIPPKASGVIASELIRPEHPNQRAREAWKAMFKELTAVPTQLVQLWFDKDLKGLGWNAGTTVSAAYASSLKSWGEMSQLLHAETWPERYAPHACEYLCGTYESRLPEPDAGAQDPGYLSEAAALQRREAERWLNSESGGLWPGVSDRLTGGLDHRRVVDSYSRVNLAWSELYVQSLPGSIQYRLEPGGSGFDNLFLAGDWTRTSINGGCAEAAFESGMKTARAIQTRNRSTKVLPKYISRQGHGEISYEVPLMIRGVTGYGFVLAVDEDRLQRFLDEQLNAVTDGVFRYQSLPFVIHSYLNAEHATSVTEPIGYLTDREVAFLVPVLEWERGKLLPEFKLWVPYLLIDRMSGMVTGREVWGYRKTLGTINLPESTQAPVNFSTETMLFKTFSPQTKGEVGTLLRTRAIDNPGVPVNEWDDAGDAFTKLLDAFDLFGLKLANWLPDAVLKRLLHGAILPVINVKQFRDSVDSNRACYQALVDSPCKLEKWSGGGILRATYEVEITTCESHQIVQDLGFGALGPNGRTVVPARFGFWSKIDFSTLKGRVIWEAD
jgi:uncharacterized protein with NAD-binding domain and iron-sulfur cluster